MSIHPVSIHPAAPPVLSDRPASGADGNIERNPVGSLPKIDSLTVMRRKVVAGSFLGNFVEWFDYAVYGYFATVIATVFFPSDNARTALIKTLALFALSFIFRPIGGIFWGHIGDRLGRRTALSASILLMSGASFAIALLPGYGSIGLAAPALLLVLRIIQGFSAAGEYAGASAYLTEFAPDGRRGLYAAIVPASTAAGLLAGSLLAAAMSAWLSTESLHSWGWRVPFLLAAPLGLVGLVIRRKLEDTPEFLAAQADREAAAAARAHLAEKPHSTQEGKEPQEAQHTMPLAAVFAERRALLVTFAAALLNAVGFYLVLSYMPTYLSEEIGLNPTRAFLAATIALACYICLVLGTGALSDRFGRKPLMCAAAILFALGSIPAFALLDTGSFVMIVLVQIALGGILALNDGVLPSFLSEQFSTPVRYTGFALTFNCANALFGGTAPMIATWLIGRTGQPLAPAGYMVVMALVTLVAVLLARETHRAALRRT